MTTEPTTAAGNAAGPIRFVIGMGTCGLSAGAQEIYDTVAGLIKEEGLDAVIESTACIGCCSREPLMDVVMPGMARLSYEKMTPKKVKQIFDKHVKEGEPVKRSVLGQFPAEEGQKPYEKIQLIDEHPYYKRQTKIVLENVGLIDPESIDDYIRVGQGYQGLRKALAQSPQDVVDMIKKSGLRGRGGGGFPTGLKWQFCRDAQGTQQYNIANADEGDPGAFMDRSVLEGDPHAMLEGMAIGAYAIGASEGYIYIRAEYPLAIKRLQKAIAQAKERGFLGKNILGSDFNYDIKIKKGSGAFVCGEETALIASIEGERGTPRPRPPYPAISGLWGKPTNINNVETWANVPKILRKGAEWYASFGVERNTGTKVFALTGALKNTGLAEVPMGITLREVVEEVGGGVPYKARAFKGAQMGGPSGGIIPADHADVAITYESLLEKGAMMGSGGVVVIDESTCVVELARFFMKFTEDESCGHCTPCRDGTKRMLEIVTRIADGEGREGDLELMENLGEAIKSSSQCGLGMTAPNPVLSTMRWFRHEYEEHIHDKTCRAHQCSKLLKFWVIPDLCTSCSICAVNCPDNAIEWEKGKVAFIDQDKCTMCRNCYIDCKFMAIE